MKLKRFFTLIVLSLAACLAFASCSGSEGVLRGVEMGMTSSEVFAVEEKRDDSGAAVTGDNQLVYHDIAVYDIPCYITYFFGVDGGLYKISCVFDEATEENYLSLIEAITDEYGEREDLPDSYGNLCEWNSKNLVIRLTFIHGNENISDSLALTYSVPTDDSASIE